MDHRQNQQGFTLIELLLVVVIISILLAVIVPRAWRANVDAKYSLVRQNATELVSYASQWAEEQIAASDSSSSATIADYFNTLAAWFEDEGDPSNPFIAAPGNNWTEGTKRQVSGRAPSEPEAAVEDIIPPERLPRNPFNGASVFSSSNNPSGGDGGNPTPIPGALACGRATESAEEDDAFYYYALVFQGTDSNFDGDNLNIFHAGQAIDSLEGLRNGIFMARLAAN